MLFYPDVFSVFPKNKDILLYKPPATIKLGKFIAAAIVLSPPQATHNFIGHPNNVLWDSLPLIPGHRCL